MEARKKEAKKLDTGSDQAAVFYPAFLHSSASNRTRSEDAAAIKDEVRRHCLTIPCLHLPCFHVLPTAVPAFLLSLALF